MNSAIARASTESFMVTPHWCEMVSLKSRSFIDLKMFWWCPGPCSGVWAVICLAPSRWRLLLQSEFAEDLPEALVRLRTRVLERDRLRVRLRPQRLKVARRLLGQRRMLAEPALEERAV